MTNGLADALAVQPRAGSTAWFGGSSDAATHTLELPLPNRSDDATLQFRAFADNEETDVFALETSEGGGERWTLLPWNVSTDGPDGQRTITADGTWKNQGVRTWGSARATLTPAAGLVRWRYTTDTTTRGRGVFVNDIRVRSGNHVLFDGENRPQAFFADGFVEARR